MSVSRASFNVLVAGSGPSGLVCAVLLARLGLSIVVIVKDSGKRHPIEVFSPHLLRMLRRLDIPLPDSECGSRCRGVSSVWAGLEKGFYDYELYSCESAVSVERDKYDRLLRKYAIVTGVTVLAYSNEMRIDRKDQSWIVTVDQQGSSFQAQFIVDASGKSGTFFPSEYAERLNADRLIACVTEIATPPHDQNLLCIEACANGWWYTTHGVGSECFILVYLSDGDMLAGGKDSRTEEIFNSFSSTTLVRRQVERTPPFEMHYAINACSSRRKKFGGERWLAIGDSALSPDPLSGEGVFFGVCSAQLAATAISSFLYTDDEKHLEAFATWCEAQWMEQRAASLRVYSMVLPPLRNGRFWARRLSGHT